MKTNLTRLLLSIMLLLCAAMSSVALPVSWQQAAQQARQFMSDINPQALIETTTVYRAPRRHAAASDAAYYVFNAQDNQGFVIVSGDDRTTEILGYSDKGHFDVDHLPTNIKSWLDGYAEQIQWLDDNNIEVTQQAKARSKVSAPARNPISPLVTSIWDQEAPFNNNCPSLTNSAAYSESTTLTGCVATGMAQVMYYNKWPQAATNSVPGYTLHYPYYDNSGSASKNTMAMSSLPSTTFDWDNMIDDYTGSYTEEEGAAVAKLMQYCGYSVEMEYGTSLVGGSSAHGGDVAKALVNYFGYDKESVDYVSRSSYTMDEWNELMYKELANRRPVVYCGQSDGGGHCFVCDGYSYDGFFHINWGWSGMSDGYFKLSILNPYASGSGGSSTSNGFSYGQEAVIGIQPGGAPADNGTFTGSSTTLSLYQPLSVTNSNGSFTVSVVPINQTSSSIVIYNLGFAVYDPTGSMTSQVGSVTLNGSLSSGYYFSKLLSFRYSQTAFPQAGTYILKPAYTTSLNGSWILMDGTVTNYLTVVVADNQISSVILHPNPSNLVVNSVSHTGDGVITHSQCLTYSITNTSESENFDGQLYLFAGSSSYQISRNGVYIPAGKTVNVEMFFDGSYDSSGNTISSGEESMILSTDASCSNQLYTYKLTMSTVGAATSLSQIELESIEFNGQIQQTSVTANGTSYPAYQVYGGSSIKATFKATNSNSSAYDQYVLAYLYALSGNNYIYTTGSEQKLHVDGNSSATFNVAFDGLSSSNQYLLRVLYYYSSNINGELYRSLLYFEDGLQFWTADGTSTGIQASGNVTIPEDACAVSLSGLSLSSVTPNSNPNTLYFIGENEAVPNGLENSNVVKGSSANEIALSAGCDFYTPTDITASKITYTRTFTKGHGNKSDVTDEQKHSGWSTIVLPFSPTSVTCGGSELTFFPSDEDSGNYWLYEFGAEDVDSHTVYFSYPTEFKANRPYIIAVPGDLWGDKWNLTGKQIVFSTENAYIYADAMPITSTGAENYKFVGNYSSKALSDIYKLNDDGYNFGLTGSASVDQFGAYFTTSSFAATSTSDKLNIGILSSNGDANSLNQVVLSERVQENSGKVYDMQGRELMNGQMAKGLYIVDGKKLYINK